MLSCCCKLVSESLFSWRVSASLIGLEKTSSSSASRSGFSESLIYRGVLGLLLCCFRLKNESVFDLLRLLFGLFGPNDHVRVPLPEGREDSTERWAFHLLPLLTGDFLGWLAEII